jgi:preprotein translocase subunit SecA
VWKKELINNENLFDYDDVNKQRNIVYHERRQILECTNSEEHFAYGEQIITEILLEFKEEKSSNKQVILLIENLFGKNLTLNHIKDLVPCK